MNLGRTYIGTGATGALSSWDLLESKVGGYIEGNQTVWEKEPMTNLAKDGQLSVFFHDGFWHPMDTLRDKRYLEELWSGGKAPWKKW